MVIILPHIKKKARLFLESDQRLWPGQHHPQSQAKDLLLYAIWFMHFSIPNTPSTFLMPYVMHFQGWELLLLVAIFRWYSNFSFFLWHTPPAVLNGTEKCTTTEIERKCEKEMGLLHRLNTIRNSPYSMGIHI